MAYKFWQMGWLDKLEDFDQQKAEIERLQNELSVLHFKNSDLQSTYQALKIDLESMRSAANSYKMHYEEALAEIERLKEIINGGTNFKDMFRNVKIEPIKQVHFITHKEIKSEAIKELAERFDSMLADYDDYDTLHIYEIKDRLDLVKELEGGTDE